MGMSRGENAAGGGPVNRDAATGATLTRLGRAVLAGDRVDPAEAECGPARIRSPGPEVVHSSERTRITRLFLHGHTVIRKEPLGPDAERRVRHEVAMLERLLGVAGLAQLAAAPRYPGSVVLEDAGGASLAGHDQAAVGR
jgi:hypothetical protein